MGKAGTANLMSFKEENENRERIIFLSTNTRAIYSIALVILKHWGSNF